MKNLMSFIFSILLTCTLASTLIAQTQPPGNRGLYFDGVDDKVIIPTFPSITFNGTSSFTVSFWFKAAKIPLATELMYPLAHVGSAVTENNKLGYLFQLRNDRSITFGISKEGFTWQNLTSPANAYDINQWVNVAAVINSGIVTLYINGTALATTLTLTSTTLSATGPVIRPLSIGLVDRGDGIPFKGQIDEVRIYNSVRSQTQIATDMISIVGTGTVAYYDFNELILTQTINNVVTAGTSGNGTLGATATAEASDPLRAFRVTNTTPTLGTTGNLLGSLAQAIFEANLFPDKNYIDFLL